MNKKELVLNALKPRVKALGFSKDEVEGAAATIANNLKLEEDASDDDVNTAIELAVEAALPFLQLSQKASSRVIEDFKKTHPKKEPTQPKPQDDDEDGKEVPEWAKAIVESNKALQEELNKLKTEKVTTSRRGRLEDVVKDSGRYGERVLKSFDRMTFATEEEFEEFLADTQEDVKTYVQELADKGLSTLTSPPTASTKTPKTDVITDSDIEALADSF